MRGLLQPEADNKAGWDEVGEATAWACLAGATEQPAVPDLGSYVESAVPAAVTVVDLDTLAIPAGDSVTSLCLHVYGHRPGTGATTAQLETTSGTALTGATVNLGASAAWHQARYVGGALTQADLDGLRVRLVNDGNAGGAPARAYAAWVEPTTTAATGKALALASYALTLAPRLYWHRLGDQDPAIDHSGHGELGDRVGDTLAPGSGLVAGGNYLDVSNDQVSGVKARTYSPFVSGSVRTLWGLFRKDSHVGAPTTFAGSGTGGASPFAPHPTWEWIDNGLLRFYATVNTFPVGFADQAVPGAGVGDLLALAVEYDDSAGLMTTWANGRRVGVVGPLGYNDVPLAYDVAADPGVLQVGYRGNGAAFETLDGGVDDVLAWERALTPAEHRQLAQLAGVRGRWQADVGGTSRAADTLPRMSAGEGRAN